MPCGSYIRTGRSGHSGITNLNGGRRTKACDSITFCSHRICRTGWWTAVLTDGCVGSKTRATTRQHGSCSIFRPESRFGFHTFRAWLDETGAPVGVQQKLMRHAHVSTTTDQYGNASALAKRKANRPIVQRLLQRPASQELLHKGATVIQLTFIGQFWTVAASAQLPVTL